MTTEVDIVLQNKLFVGVEVPEKVTVADWKQLLGQGELGDKVLYAQKLELGSVSSNGDPLAEQSMLPARPEKILVNGPGAVITSLQAALRKKMGEPEETDIMKKLEQAQRDRLKGDTLPLVHSGKDELISFYANALQGLRETQEDRTMAVLRIPGYESASIFGIFDGHGGPQVSDLVARIMPGIVSQALQKVPPKKGLTLSFAEIERQVKRIKQTGLVGTTAVVCLILRGEAGSKPRVLVAHLGDSRAVLCANKTAVQITEDHKADNEKEVIRIEKAGGRVDNRGRIDGGLNISRAFGDFGYKADSSLKIGEQKVIAIPEITEVKLKEADEFLLLASDGVFDALSNQEVVDLVTSKPDMDTAINQLLEEATVSNDNVSACMIRFPQV